jgi:hypothetical protein
MKLAFLMQIPHANGILTLQNRVVSFSRVETPIGYRQLGNRSRIRSDGVHATVTMLSVTVSSCPTVSLPNRIGTNAPTATTQRIVPK